MLWEERDFQEIDAAYRPKIRRYLARLIGEEEAEDLTQEVLVKVSRSLETFKGESQLSTWIYRIATNTALDRLRSPAYKQAARSAPLPENEVGQAECGGLGAEVSASAPEAEAMRQEMYRCFWSFVEKLPLNYRLVVILSELEELTDQEIAKALGLSLGTVKIRLHRGRARLFQELKAYCKPEDWL